MTVSHYLGAYQIRKGMQDDGVTSPSDDIKEFTAEFVEKLSKLPLDDEIIIEGYSFFDVNKNLIAKIPVPNKAKSK